MIEFAYIRAPVVESEEAWAEGERFLYDGVRGRKPAAIERTVLHDGFQEIHHLRKSARFCLMEFEEVHQLRKSERFCFIESEEA